MRPCPLSHGLAAPFLAALLLYQASGPCARASCLPDAVPPESRKYIQDRVPFGVWVGEWNSATLSSHVVKLLAEERMGYVTVFSGSDGSSITGLFATAGCRLPHRYATDPDCSSDNEFVHHVMLEAWGEGYLATVLKQMSAVPGIVPEDAGDLGYVGSDGTHVKEQQRQQAYESEGLALDYYRGYDAKWNRPWAYFDKYTSIDPSQLRPCNETRFTFNHFAHNFLQVTGDEGGVSRDGDGTLAARCWHGSWWLAPACRAMPEHCIPSITGSDGWGLWETLQRSAVLNMPLALAVAKNETCWRSLNRKMKTLPYWFQPGVEIDELGSTLITFPPYNARERMQQIWVSSTKTTPIGKRVHQRLRSTAPRLREFIFRVKVTQESIKDMIMEAHRNGTPPEQVACNWVKKNEDIWKSWIPSPTECNAGMGLVNEDGSFVRNRSAARSCEWCPPGRYAKPLRDARGATHVCEECPSGTAQPSPGKQECGSCPPGKYTATAASRECIWCGIGRFQDAFGSAGCEECPATMSTMGLGALAASECLCPEDTYRSASEGIASPCRQCPEGMSCKIGSDEENIPRVRDGHSKGSHPVPLPMYYATYAQPLSVSRCVDERACPGGGFEACAENMEGLACGRCLEGYYRTLHGCQSCPEMLRSGWFTPVVAIVLAPPLCCLCRLLYTVSQDPVEKWGSPGNSINAAVTVTLMHLQTIAAIQTCDLRYPSSFTDLAKWTEFPLNPLAGLRLECGSSLDFKGTFVLRLSMPVYAMLIFLATFAISRLVQRKVPSYHMDGHTLMSCFGGVYNTFFIAIASHAFSLFQCYDHPNGKRSLRLSPDVLCPSDTWHDLLIVAIIAVLVFCAAPLALFSYATYRAPAHFHEELFRKKWRFLFIKFRPAGCRWGPLLLVKGIWLHLTTVFFKKGNLQLIWLTIVHGLYQLLCLVVLPWRSMGVMALDAGMHTMLLFSFSLLPYFTFQTFQREDNLHTVIYLGIASWFAPLLGTPLFILAKVHERIWPAPPGQWHSLAEQLRDDFATFGQDVYAMKELLETLPTADLWSLYAAREVCVQRGVSLQRGGSLRVSGQRGVSLRSVGSISNRNAVEPDDSFRI